MELRRLYRMLKLIRRTEERIAEIYPSDKIKSPVHLSIGQEAVAVGVCDALAPQDYVSGTYRGHATYLAKGGNLNAMMAELFGKRDGCAGGKGGSMHLIDLKANVLGCSSVVGTTVPIALGYALVAKRRAEPRMVAAFFGDGASEEGAFYESLNFAALHRLPVLFVCENNFFAIHQPLSKRWATDQLVERARTFGMPAHQITSGDVREIRSAAKEFADMARAGSGPALLECHTYRWREHVGPGEDYDAGFRTRDELASWTARDPIQIIGNMIGEDERATIARDV